MTNSTPIVPASSNSRTVSERNAEVQPFRQQASHNEQLVFGQRVTAQSPANSSLLMIGSGEPAQNFTKHHSRDQGTFGNHQVLISEPGQIMTDSSQRKLQGVPRAFQTIQGPSSGQHSSKTSRLLSADKSHEIDAHYMDPDEAYLQYKLDARKQDQAN